MSWGIGLAAILLASIVRFGRGWGNSTDWYAFPQISFFLDSKYPPNLFHNLWFFGAVSFMVGTMHFVGQFAMPAVRWLGGIGRVPFFFYCMHLTVLAIVADRFGVYYRQGAVTASFVGWVALLAGDVPALALVLEPEAEEQEQDHPDDLEREAAGADARYILLVALLVLFFPLPVNSNDFSAICSRNRKTCRE